jgi:hypothetical protein
MPESLFKPNVADVAIFPAGLHAGAHLTRNPLQ